MTINQAYLGRFYFTGAAGSNDLNFDNGVGGDWDVDLTSGYYFTLGYTGESTAQLCEHVQAQIRATLDGTGGKPDETSATVTFNLSTKRVTITTSGSYALTVGTSLANVLGLSATYTSAASFVGVRQPRYTWFPGEPPSSHMVDITKFWAEQSQTSYGRAASGATYSCVGTMLYHNEISYTLLDSSVVITPSSGTVYEDFQQWYTDVLHAGQYFRVVLNLTGLTTAYAAANYITAMYGAGGIEQNKLPDFIDFANRHIESYMGLWDINLPLVKYVSA